MQIREWRYLADEIYLLLSRDIFEISEVLFLGKDIDRKAGDLFEGAGSYNTSS